MDGRGDLRVTSRSSGPVHRWAGLTLGRVRGRGCVLRPAPLSVLDQQLTPKQLSGLLPEIVLSVSLTGKVVKRPPPWTVMPGLAVNVLPVTVVLVRLSCGLGGGGKNTSFHTPPPRACPVGPFAVAVLSLMVVSYTSSSPLPC